MSLVVYSKSRSFENHISALFGEEVSFRNKLSPPIAGAGNVYLVHAPSFARELPAWLVIASKKGAVIGVAEENPVVENMLAYTQAGALGYFNAYMSAPNYIQLVRLLATGQSWFPPLLLADAFDLARKVIQIEAVTDPLECLTKREREVAMAVAQGKSNKLIAKECDISERTVKTHLTHIFKKLSVKDRVALVIHLNQFDAVKSDISPTG